MEGSFKASTSQSKLFWILNCTWYCPYSVALFEWHAYMVKIVETGGARSAMTKRKL
jgi:hypothetical protein